MPSFSQQQLDYLVQKTEMAYNDPNSQSSKQYFRNLPSELDIILKTRFKQHIDIIKASKKTSSTEQQIKQRLYNDLLAQLLPAQTKHPNLFKLIFEVHNKPYKLPFDILPTHFRNHIQNDQFKSSPVTTARWDLFMRLFSQTSNQFIDKSNKVIFVSISDWFLIGFISRMKEFSGDQKVHQTYEEVLVDDFYSDYVTNPFLILLNSYMNHFEKNSGVNEVITSQFTLQRNLLHSEKLMFLIEQYFINEPILISRPVVLESVYSQTSAGMRGPRNSYNVSPAQSSLGYNRGISSMFNYSLNNNNQHHTFSIPHPQFIESIIILLMYKQQKFKNQFPKWNRSSSSGMSANTNHNKVFTQEIDEVNFLKQNEHLFVGIYNILKLSLDNWAYNMNTNSYSCISHLGRLWLYVTGFTTKIQEKFIIRALEYIQSISIYGLYNDVSQWNRMTWQSSRVNEAQQCLYLYLQNHKEKLQKINTSFEIIRNQFFFFTILYNKFLRSLSNGDLTIKDLFFLVTLFNIYSQDSNREFYNELGKEIDRNEYRDLSEIYQSQNSDHSLYINIEKNNHMNNTYVKLQKDLDKPFFLTIDSQFKANPGKCSREDIDRFQNQFNQIQLFIPKILSDRTSVNDYSQKPERNNNSSSEVFQLRKHKPVNYNVVNWNNPLGQFQFQFLYFLMIRFAFYWDLYVTGYKPVLNQRNNKEYPSSRWPRNFCDVRGFLLLLIFIYVALLYILPTLVRSIFS